MQRLHHHETCNDINEVIILNKYYFTEHSRVELELIAHFFPYPR